MQGDAERVVRLLRADGRTLSVAESLTGGLVTAALVAVPGASAVLRGGIVAYSEEAKRDVLGVPDALLQARGTVAADTAVAMAAGVRALLRSDWGVATTGVAGPGPSEGHPAGTVFVAVSGPASGREEATRVRALHLSGTRSDIRDGSVDAALRLLLQCHGGKGVAERAAGDGVDASGQCRSGEVR